MRRTLGPYVCQWMESHLCHGPGDVQGDPLVLDAEEIRFIMAAYAIDDHGRRLVHRGMYSRPKGRRKSEIAAAVCAAEALAPVRFDGWDAAGFPLARHVTYPFIRICATEEEQSGNTYDGVHFMLTEGPLREVKGLDVGLTRTFIPGGGEIRPSTASAASKDGGKESHVCFDETHLYEARRPELVQMHKTVSRNLTKRKDSEPWANETTTMFEPGMGSVAENAYVYAKQLEKNGVVDPTFLFDHREAPAIKDWDDDGELRAALVDVYGDAAGWVDFDSKIASLRRGEQSRSDFARYYLNQPTADEQVGLVDLGVWDGLAEPVESGVFIPHGSRVALSLDGSRAHDQAVVVWCADPDGLGRVRADILVMDSRRDRLPDPLGHHVFYRGSVDYDDMADVVTGFFSDFRVGEAVYGQDYVEAATRVIDRRVPEAKVAKIGRNTKVEREALAALDTVLARGLLVHRGDPVLRRQVANTLVVRDPVSGVITRLRPRNDGEPIHGVYALAHAVWRVTRARRASTYEDRGMRVIGLSEGGLRPASAGEIADARDVYASVLDEG